MFLKRPFDVSRMAIFATLAGAALATGGCTSIRDHRGYIMDPALTNAIQPGIDNKQSVEGTLGHPSLASEYGAPVWYYISSTTSQRVLGVPHTEDHSVLKVAFDSAGNVTSVTKAGMDDVRDINPNGDKTETMGRDRSFIQDLFGNIGTVGSLPGGSAGSAGGGPNGS